MVGLNWFLRFAREVGALQADDAKAIWMNAWRALGKAAAAQTLGQAAEDSAQRFLNLIAAVIDRGDAYLRDATTEVPAEEEKGRRYIGWTTNDGVLLLEPELAFAAVHQLAAQQGEAFPVRPKTLGKRLEDAGLPDTSRQKPQYNSGDYRTHPAAGLVDSDICHFPASRGGADGRRNRDVARLRGGNLAPEPISEPILSLFCVNRCTENIEIIGENED